MFRGLKVLVAGGTGLIGIPLVRILVERGAKVRIASMDDPSRAHPDAEFIRFDLRVKENCLTACRGMDFVFNLLCAKGSPSAVAARPASIISPLLLFNTNLMDAAHECGAGGYLYTSSVGIYPAAEVFREDDALNAVSNDRFAGGAKKMGELLAEAYRIEHGWKNVTIVRPSNVYGPYDNFDSENAMVVPSLIRRAVDGQNPFAVWGDGSPERDFIHSDDVARGILLAVEKAPGATLNLGAGYGVSIRRLVEVVLSQAGFKPSIVWDASKLAGDRKRIMDISRARAIGFEPAITLERGIMETMQWYRQHRVETGKRYDIFDSQATVRSTPS